MLVDQKNKKNKASVSQGESHLDPQRSFIIPARPQTSLTPSQCLSSPRPAPLISFNAEAAASSRHQAGSLFPRRCVPFPTAKLLSQGCLAGRRGAHQQ